MSNSTTPTTIQPGFNVIQVTDAELARLVEILDHSFRSSVNHLVSSTLAQPGDWHNRAPHLATTVETDRMLAIRVSRANANPNGGE